MRTSSRRAFRCLGLAAAALLAAPGPMPGASSSTRAPTASELLQHLSSLHGLKAQRVLSGQFIGYGDSVSYTKEVDPLYKKTGHMPAIVGADYHDYGKHGPRTKRVNKALINYWKRGGLVTISNHAGNPATGGNSKDRKLNIEEMLIADSKAAKGWDKELDAVVEGLRELKKAGVLVLWRPFHEMNGGWFWWGKADPEVFKALWRRMHARFTKEGLDNLLWVYSADADPKTALLYYPGSRYADIVGIDVYRSDPENIPKETYDKLTRLGKPFAITEYGTGNSKASSHSGASPLLRAIKSKFPKTAFFMMWNSEWALHLEPDAKEVLDDPWVASLPGKTPAPASSLVLGALRDLK